MLRRAGLLLAGGVGSGFLYTTALSPNAVSNRDHLASASDGIVRFSRSAYHGSIIMVDYWWNVKPVEKEKGDSSDEYKAIRKVVDLRSAQRLLDVCKAHGGLYIKFAQALSVNTMGLPKEYTETLAAAQDKAEARPWSDVSRVFFEDTGKRPEDVFETIDESPIGSASLAQVHRATLRGGKGEEVAVKIQYPLVRRQVAHDLRAMSFFAETLGALFPDYGFAWFLPELEASIRDELSFLKEAQNGVRVKKMFEGQADVHIPAVYTPYCSERVLVMEYIKGCKVTDAAALKALSVQPALLAQTVSRFFNDQIHVHAFVHCDPHPGNLLVRASPGVPGGWQLVVLDHGMYRRLTPQFRAAYCRLWKALITQDSALGEKATVELGLKPRAYETLSVMLTYRSPTSRAALGSRMSKEDIDRLKGEWKDVKAGDINAFMQTLPRDLLFVSRCINMVRNVNQTLGGTSRQRFVITGQSAIRGLTLTDAMTDFSDKSASFALAAGSQSRSIDETRPPTAPTPAASFATIATALAGWLGSLVDSTQSAPPPSSSSSSPSSTASPSPLGSAEPLTYLNALSRGVLKTDPTESELQTSNIRSPLRKLSAWFATCQLQFALSSLDAVAFLFEFFGYFRPHDGVASDGKEIRHREAG